MENQTCKFCGAPIDENGKRCGICGALIAEEQVIIKKTHRKKVKISSILKEKKLSFIIKNSILLLLSIMLFIFAFLPTYKIPIDLEDFNIDGDVEIKISSVDAIIFAFDSFKKLDYYDISDSLMTEKITEMSEDLAEEFDDLTSGATVKLSKAQERKIEKILNYSLRLELQSATYYTTGYMTLALITSSIYILFALALLTLCIINFVFMLIGKKALFRLCNIFVFAMPIVISANYFSIAPYNTKSELASGLMGAATIMSIIFCSLYALYLFIDRLIIIKNVSVSKIIKNTITLICAIFIMCMTFAPLLNTEITANFYSSSKTRRANAKIDATFFAYIHLDPDSVQLETMDTYEALNTLKMFEDYTRSEVVYGEADALNYIFLAKLVSSKAGEYTTPIFSLVYYILFAALISGGMIALQSILYLCTGEKIKYISLFFKLITIIAALSVLVFTIVFIVTANSSVSFFDLDKYYKLFISAGPIMLLVFATVSLFIPSRDVKIIYQLENSEEQGEEEAA